MFYKFYSDWAYLTKQEVGILCSVASMGGYFEGSVSELYRLIQIKKVNKPNSDQKREIENCIFSLEERLFLTYDSIGAYKIKLFLIQRGMEINVHEELFAKIKQIHKPSIAWQNIIKMFLFLTPVKYVFAKNIVLANILNIEVKEKTEDKERAKSNVITHCKRVLKRVGCLQDELVRDYYEEKGEIKPITLGTIFKFAIPPEYEVSK